jgi:chromosome segregation ATPase
VSCKACRKFRSWIRRWLGIDEVITKQGEYFTKYVDMSLSPTVLTVAKLQEKSNKLTEAGGLLESTIRQFDEAVTAISKRLNENDQELAERLEVLRGMIREQRQENNKLRNLLKDQDKEIADISLSVKRIEYPGFEPIAAYDPESSPS